MPDTDVKDLLERGLSAIANRFDERSREINTLSNDLTRVATNLENLTKSMEKLDRDISQVNLNGLKADVVTLQKEFKDFCDDRRYDKRYITACLVSAILALLSLLGTIVWHQIQK